MSTPKRIASRRRGAPPARSKRSPLPDGGKQKERASESPIAFSRSDRSSEWDSAVAKSAIAERNEDHKSSHRRHFQQTKGASLAELTDVAEPVPSRNQFPNDQMATPGHLVSESPRVLIDEARRILACADTIEHVCIDDDGMRIIAGMHALRRLAEESIETLISFLDELEPDPDLEPSTNVIAPGLPSGALDECEPEEGEPSLGFLEQVDQSHIALGAPNHDLEGEHDGREPDEADEEPSLGWTDMESRYGRYPDGCQSLIDAEQEHDGRENEDEAVGRPGGWSHPEDENGIADEGGIQEQFAGCGMSATAAI